MPLCERFGTLFDALFDIFLTKYSYNQGTTGLKIYL